MERGTRDFEDNGLKRRWIRDNGFSDIDLRDNGFRYNGFRTKDFRTRGFRDYFYLSSLRLDLRHHWYLTT